MEDYNSRSDTCTCDVKRPCVVDGNQCLKADRRENENCSEFCSFPSIVVAGNADLDAIPF